MFVRLLNDKHLWRFCENVNHYVCMLYFLFYFLFLIGHHKYNYIYNYNLILYYRLVLYFIMINVYILF